MASHVVIIDSSFRRTNIKCNPNTYLSDVLAEACQKLKLQPEQYGFKYNKKPVDLSRTFRLSGLPSGAQLELVQASRTAAPVNIALQLPNNTRLTEKFPSTTSLWQILRRFESGTAGGSTPSNFTQRGVAKQENGNTGAGRLYYETPVVNVMGRELASFVDLQKTLAQLGVTSGSALLRLSFKGTDKPLEEAMMQISEYFKTSDSTDDTRASESTQPPPEPETIPSSSNDTAAEDPTPSEEPSSSTAPSNEQFDPPGNPIEPLPNPPRSETSPTNRSVSGQRSLKVFLPPTTSSPAAATQPYNDADYVPTVEHAKLHQARLNKAGLNQRLLSDKELADREAERQLRLDAVNQVKVRIRFPDQTTVETIFGKDDRGQDVYGMVRDVMSNPGEQFTLTYVGSKGGHAALRDGPQKLVKDDGWKGNMLVNLTWDENVSAQVKKQPVLKEEVSKQAVPMKVESPIFEEELEKKPEKKSGGIFGQGSRDTDRQKSVEAKLKGFLGLGKKK